MQPLRPSPSTSTRGKSCGTQDAIYFLSFCSSYIYIVAMKEAKKAVVEATFNAYKSLYKKLDKQVRERYI